MAAHILLVEDDPDDVELMLRMMEHENFEYSVEVVRDGTEALAYLEEARAGRRVAPAGLVMDLRMPKLGGLDVLRRLRLSPELAQGLPVAVLTSSADEGDRAEALRLGARLYRRKPSSPDGYAAIAAELRALLKPPG